MSSDLLRLAPKVFVTHRSHNGTALLIARLTSALAPSTAIGRFLRDRRRRRLNRRFGCYVSPLARIGKHGDLPHPIGIVIGDRAVIAANAVVVYDGAPGGVARRRPGQGPRAAAVGPVRVGRRSSDRGGLGLKSRGAGAIAAWSGVGAGTISFGIGTCAMIYCEGAARAWRARSIDDGIASPPAGSLSNP